MKREHILALAGAALLAFAAAAGRLASPPERTVWLSTSSCAAPATRFSASDSGMAVVLFHGLAANRRTMRHLARGMAFHDVAVFTADWPGHGDSAEPFSFAALDECAEQLLEALAARGELRLERTVVIGHSAGAAAALRLADRLPVAGTIAISPGVTALPRRMPANLLVFVGQWDIPRIGRFVDELADAAGEPRTDTADFVHRRAFDVLEIPRATHASLLFDADVLRESADWVVNVFDPDDSRQESAYGGFEVSWNFFSTLESAAHPLAGLLGLLLLFPLAATVAVRAVGARGELTAVGATPPGGTLVRWAAAGLLAALALRYWTPLEFLRLYDGDWMASYAFLTGVVLLFLLWRRPERAAVMAVPRNGGETDAATEPARAAGLGRTEVRPYTEAKQAAGRTEVRPYIARNVRAVVAGAAAAMAAMLAFGWWLDWQLYDAWLNAPRWWRFAAAAPFLLPYLLAEEIALGAPSVKWRTEVRRYIRFILLRAVLAGLAAAACFTIGGALLAILLGPYIALGGIVVRLGADAIRRRTGSAAAAAVFSAILAAWALAASLPLL